MSDNKGLIVSNISGSERGTIHSDAALIAVTGAISIAREATGNAHAMPGADVSFHVAGTPNDGLTVSVFGGDVVISGSLNIKGDLIAQSEVGEVDDLIVDGTLTVNEGTTLKGDVSAEQDVAITGSLNVLSDASIDGRLQLGDDLDVAGRLTVTGSTILSGNVLMENDLEVLGTANFNDVNANDASVQFDLSIGDDLRVANTLTVTGSTILSGNVLLENDLEVQGTTNLALTNIDDANVLTDLDVANDVRIENDLTVTGSTILSGNVLMENDLEVLGTTNLALTNIDDANVLTDLDVGSDVRIAGNLTVTGSTILSGNVLMENDLEVQGVSDLNDVNVITNLDVGSDLKVAGDLTITGSTILSGNVLLENDLEVQGTTQLSDVSLIDLDVSNDLRIAGDLTVTGSTILSGNVLMENDLDVLGSLVVQTDADVQGMATLADAVVLGDLEVQGNVDVKQNLYVTGTLDVLSTTRLLGDALMEGDLTVEGDLIITGSTTLVAPLTTLTDATVGGNLEVLGDVNVPDGSITIGDEIGIINVGDPDGAGVDVLEIRSEGVLRLSGSVQVPLDLNVTGSAKFLNGIDVEGDVITSGSAFDVLTDALTITISGSALISDVSPVPRGLVYAEDYGDTFVQESLVTRRFVDRGFVAINRYDSVIFVDSVEGDDDSGLPYRIDLPFKTIAAAIMASEENDTIRLRPGTYAEWGLSLGDNRTIEGEGSSDNVFVGSLSATSNVLTIGKGVTIQNISFYMPSAGHASIVYSSGLQTVDRSNMYRLNFIGDNSTGTGVGFIKSGTSGRLIGSDINCSTGGYSRIGIVSSGVMTLDNLRFPTTVPSDNTNVIGALFEATNTGRLQISGLNCGSPNIDYVVRTSTTNANQAPIVVMFNTNCVSANNFAYVGCDGTFLGVYGGKINTVGLDFVFDAGLDGFNDAGAVTTLQITAAHQSKNSFPFAALASEFGLSYFQERTANAEAGYISVGTDNVVGFGEFGSAFYAGRGRPYNAGSFFYTTDGTASPTSDGANFTNITTAASDREGNTFGFQGTTAGHSILFTTPRQELDGSRLRYFGIVSKQTIGSTGGSYIFEIKTGASEWTQVRVEAVSVERNYRYANNVFLRSNSDENIIFGIDNDTTWPEFTINGITGRWARVRIASNLTTGPTFQQWKLVPSNANFSSDGYRNAFGLAKWRRSVTVGGSVFNFGGNIASSGIGIIFGNTINWIHYLTRSTFTSPSGILTSQVIIPNGICTAFPIYLRGYFIPHSASNVNTATLAANVTSTIKALTVESSGVSIANVNGSIEPTERSLANTNIIGALDATSYTQTIATTGEVLPATNTNQHKIRSYLFGPYYIDDYYEGDAFVFEIGASFGNNVNLSVLNIDIEGVAFSDGRPV